MRMWVAAIQSSAARGPQPVFNTWINYIVWMAAGVTVQFILLALVGFLIWGLLQLAIRGNSPVIDLRTGLLRQLAAWLLAAAATFVVLGLAPAEIIGHAVQGWTAFGLFLIAMVAFPVGVTIALGGQISLRTLLGMVLAYALVFGALLFWNAMSGDRPLEKLPPQVWIPARGAGGLSGAALQARFTRGSRMSPTPDLRWAAVQWALYHGAEWTIGSALSVIGLWWLVRANRVRKRSLTTERSARPTAWMVAGTFRVVARSAIGAAAVALTLYLALAPERIEPIEAFYQIESARAQHPDAALAGIQKVFDDLAVQEQKSGSIRKQVEREIDMPPDSQ
jgi:hypothetical protein